jgi:formiminotetrahydrofolate cyclodeaminase
MDAAGDLKVFLDALSGDSPAPGGGSAAAASGAMGAALVSMVCRLTIGKKKYADVQNQVQAILEKSEALRIKLTSLVDEDIQAFEQVMAAYRLPKESEAEQASRRAAVQSALKSATLIPMETARACAEVLGLSDAVADIGNANAVSDAGVASALAAAGLRGAALNVLTNLGSLEDVAFAGEAKVGLDALLQKVSIADTVLRKVQARFAAA